MSLRRKLRRAVGVSAHEVQVRAKQLAFSKVNEILARRSKAIFPFDRYLKSINCSPHELPAWFNARESRRLITHDRKNRLGEFFKEYPAIADQLTARAERILRDEMYVLGHGPVPFVGDAKWHTDPILDVISPRRFYSRIDFLDCREVGDSKHVWEPSRFAWAYWLGAAHVITGERRWSEKFLDLTSNWFDSNPYPIGVNYCSALEMAIRAYAWLWAIELFCDQAAVVRAAFPQLLQGIWISCRHIENNLSHYFAPNTHLLGEAFALFVCGACFPEFKESQRWRALGDEILTREGLKQFHNDGTHRELSTCYHLYATDLYLHALMISKRTGYALSPEIATTGRKAASRLAALVTSDRTLPPLNDCDDGRLDWFSVDPLDAKPSLLAAGELWPDLDDSREIGNSNGYHLWLGTESLLPAPITRKQACFCSPLGDGDLHMPIATSDIDSGIVTHRNATRDYLLFRAGPFGYMDCGHSHDGPTSLILHLAGRPVIVDSGTGAYSQSLQTRNRFRTASSKNVLTLQGLEPSVPGDWFDWCRTTRATLTSVRRSEKSFECAGGHGGFAAALGFAVEVTRAVILKPGFALVVDEWNAAKPVTSRIAWVLHPDLELASESTDVLGDVRYWRGTLQGSSAVRFHFLMCQLSADSRSAVESYPVALNHFGDSIPRSAGETMRRQSARFSISSGPFSPAYGVLQETRNLVMESNKSNGGQFITAFSVHSIPQFSTNRAGRLILSAGETDVVIPALEDTQAAI